MPTPTKIRIAVIGTGRMGLLRLAALRRLPQVEVAGLCGGDLERARSLATRFGTTYVTKPESLAARGDLQGVIVSGVNTTHHPVLRGLLGKVPGLLIERPYLTLLRQARELISLGRQCRTHVRAARIHLRHGAVSALRQRLPLLGELETGRIDITCDIERGWRGRDELRGPYFVGSLVEPLDLVRACLAEVAWISANRRRLDTDQGPAMISQVWMALVGGATVLVTHIRKPGAAYSQRWDLIGTAGTLTWEGDEVRTDTASGRTLDHVGAPGWDERLLADTAEFVTALRAPEPDIEASVWDKDTLNLCMAAEESNLKMARIPLRRV